MLATLASKPFSDPDWLFEIKWDGYRVQAVVDGGQGPDLDPQPQGRRDVLPAPAVAAVWIDAQRGHRRWRGRRARRRRSPRLLRCSRTQARRAGRVGGLVYQAFDLLYLDGRLAARRPARGSQAAAPERAQGPPAGPLRLPRRRRGRGVLRGRAGATGSRASSPSSGARRYEPGRRSNAWLKLKIRPEQELVVGGWTPGEGNARDLGALAVGVYEDGKLRFAGKVGSGFTGAMRKDLLAKLQPLASRRPAVRPAAAPGLQGSLGRRPRRGDLGPAGARDPRRARRLDARRHRPPGGVQGPRAGPRPDDRATRERGRDDERGPSRRGGGAGGADPASRAMLGRRTTTPQRSAWSAKAAHGRQRQGNSTAKAKPTATRRPTDIPDAGASPTTSSRRSTPSARKASGTSAATSSSSPTSTSRCSRRDPTATPDHEARADPLLRPDRADDAARTSPTGRSTSSGSRTAPARPASGRRTSPTTAPKWLTRWHETGVDGRDGPRRQRPPHRRPRRDAVLARQPGQLRDPRLDRAPARRRGSPTFALIDIDPGEKTTWEETLVLARLYRTALGHLGVRGYPKTTGKRGIQIWIPIVPKYSFDETSAWVERVSRAVGSTVPDLVSWEWAKGARKGRARLDYTQNASHQDARRAVRRPARAGRARSRRRSPGTSWTTRTCDPTAGRSGRSSSASPSAATCSRPPRPTPRSCRRSETGTRPAAPWHDWTMTDDTIASASPTDDELRAGSAPERGVRRRIQRRESSSSGASSRSIG